MEVFWKDVLSLELPDSIAVIFFQIFLFSAACNYRCITLAYITSHSAGTYFEISCFRWREVQLMPLLNSKSSSSSSPPAKLRKLDACQNNSVFFTSGHEAVSSSSTSADRAAVTPVSYTHLTLPTILRV